MSSDTKVGLALGILVMGIAIAFFFRIPVTLPKQDRVKQLAPGIAEIDQELIHRINRPYLPAPSANDVDGDHENPQANASFPPLNQIIYQGAATAPEPLSIKKTADTFVTQQTTDLNQLASIDSLPELLPLDNTGITTKTLSNKSASKHEVKQGETLSSIAQHYLGSPVRFREIYEMNMEIMESPDSLKTGMILTIPLIKVDAQIPEAQTQTLNTTLNQPLKHARRKDEQIETLADNMVSPHPELEGQLPDTTHKTKRFLAAKKVPGVLVQSSGSNP